MSIIGIDIGGTKCAVIRADNDGSPQEIHRFATTNLDETLEAIFSGISELRPGGSPVFGISCGGPLDSKTGMIQSPPNLPGWDNIPIVKMMTDRFGGRAYLMNDANAGALAEWRFGAAQGFKNILFFTHGTGMGGGLILDGRLYEGTTGDAGEVGHIRLDKDGPVGYGKAGSFEGFCSGGGIAKLAGSAGFHPADSGSKENVTARDVALAAEKGDEEALAILSLSGRYLGQGLAILIDILNPEIIVLGSIYSRAGKFLEPAMRKALAEEARSRSLQACKIVPAKLGEDIGNYAAVSIALYKEGKLG